MGGVAGITIFWGNDYGISSAIILLFVRGIICLKQSIYRKKAKYIFFNFLIIVSSFFCLALISAAIITKGHPSRYVWTTIQVSQYQSWYSVHDANVKVYYLWDIIILDPYALFILGMALIYICKLLKSEMNYRNIKRYVIPLCVILTGYFAVHLYRISDGGGTEYFWIIYFSVFISEIAKAIKNVIDASSVKRELVKKTELAIYLITYAVVFGQIGMFVTNKINTVMNGVYVSELGGTLSGLGDTVISTRDHLDGASVFNTYASAVETVSNQYQPSGIDYIIHVLGDGQREHYMDTYKKFDADYVGLIREDYTVWEGFIRGVNWFWYRNMLNERVISFSNIYQHYYSKADLPQKCMQECSIQLIQNELDKVTIKLEYPDKKYEGLADIYLEYEINKTPERRNAFCFKTMGEVKDINFPEGNEVFYNISLPGNFKSVYIPIIIKNGVGEVNISSFPQRHTNICMKTVKCLGLFQNALNIVPVYDIRKDINGNLVLKVQGNWIDEDKPIVKVQHENFLTEVLDGAFDGVDTEFVIKYNKNFIESIDKMSSVKLLTI